MLFGSSLPSGSLSSFLPSSSPFSRRAKSRAQHEQRPTGISTALSRDIDTGTRSYNMGQAQTKAAASHHESSSQKTSGNNPTTARPHDVALLQAPVMSSPPLSAPSAYRPSDGLSTSSRETGGPRAAGDQSSHHSKKSIASGTRHLARKLSSRTKLNNGSRRPSRPFVESQMQAFEALVAAAERAAGVDPPPTAGVSVKGSPLSTRKPHRQSSQAHISYDPPASAPPLPNSAMAPHSLDSTPPPGSSSQRSLSRKTSSGSSKSGRASLKSSRRAEQEWRAKVAAIAHASSTTEGIVSQHRGPVPPKRTPAKDRASRSRSRGPELLVPPGPPIPVDQRGSARTSMSNQSFVTLGHQAARSSSVPRRRGHRSMMHDRQASVPRSVTSSLASNTLAASLSSADQSVLAASDSDHLLDGQAENYRLRHVKSGQDVAAIGSRSPLAVAQIVATSSPSFRLSDTDGSMAPKAPARQFMPSELPESSLPPTHPASCDDKLIPSLAAESGHGVRLKVSINNVRLAQQPGTPSSRLPGVSQAAESDPSPTRAKGAGSTPLPAEPTPRADGPPDTPDTPISPTTAFLMTAPLDSLKLGTYSFDSPGPLGLHPYSLVPDKLPLTSPLAISPGQAIERRVPFPDSPRRAAGLTPLKLTSFGPFSPPPKNPVDKHSKLHTEKSRRPSILQAKKTQPTAAIMGSGYDPKAARSDLERQRQKMKKMGVDLTPGMESGHRPPKSGLPVDDLHRWLAQTSLASA